MKKPKKKAIKKIFFDRIIASFISWVFVVKSTKKAIKFCLANKKLVKKCTNVMNFSFTMLTIYW